MHLLSPVLLQAAGTGFGDNLAWVPLVGIVAVFYFLLIRPQQQQAKKHKELVASLRKGDQVVTQSGLFGKIYSVSDKEVVLEIGGNTKVRWLKSQIAGIERAETEEAGSAGRRAEATGRSTKETAAEADKAEKKE